MIQIYIPGNEDFTSNGDYVLNPTVCELPVELNGTWVLTLEHPIDDEGRWKYITENAVLKVPTWQDDDQLYRISKVVKQDYWITAVAYPIFYDSAKDCFLLDVRPTDKTGQQALNLMTADSPYSGISNITTVNTAYFVRRNLLSAINGSESPTFIERWGGEILYDNYTVKIYNRIGGNYGAEARYGLNIEGMEYTVDMSGVVTRIVPLSYNGHMMTGTYVDSSHINNYPNVIWKEIHYENIKLAEDAGSARDDDIICADQSELDDALLAAAQADFASGIDLPKVTMNIDMIALEGQRLKMTEPLLDTTDDEVKDTTDDDIFTVFYQSYKTLEDIQLGDDVRCRHYKLDISTTARVVALTWDCIMGRVTHITLGDYKENYVKGVADAVKRVNTTIREDGSIVAEMVRGYLDGSQTQLKTQYDIAQRQDVLAILFENLDPESAMYGALGIGTQGLCISKTRTADGRGWVWTTGVTANGMNASMGIFGIIADQLGINYINLDTGEVRLGATSTIGGQTIGEYVDGVTGYVDGVIGPIEDDIDELFGIVDGQIEQWFGDGVPTLSNYPAVDWAVADYPDHEGDSYFDRINGDAYRFLLDTSTQTYGWSIITDSVATQALALASEAKDTADGKRRVFLVQPTPPYDAGDLWVTGGSDGKELWYCVTSKASGTYSVSDWSRVPIQASLASVATSITGLQDQIDEKVEIFYGAYNPTSSTLPESGWSADEKDAHVGDMFYNTATGKPYRYNKSGSTYSWVLTDDKQIATALSNASAAQTSADSKATIFTGTTNPAPPYRVGDIWLKGGTGHDEMWYCTTTKTSGSYSANDWTKAPVQETAEFAKQYMTFNTSGANAGLVIGSSDSTYNVQIRNSSIRIRDDTTPLFAMSGTEINFYRPETTKVAMHLDANKLQFRRPSSNEDTDPLAMQLDSGSLTFYRANGKTAMVLNNSVLQFMEYNSSTAVAAEIGTDGLFVKKGKVGGFTVSSSADTSASTGHVFASSLYSHVSSGNYVYEVGLHGEQSALGDKLIYVARKSSSSSWSNPTYLFSTDNYGYTNARKLTIDPDTSGNASIVIYDQKISCGSLFQISGSNMTIGNINASGAVDAKSLNIANNFIANSNKIYIYSTPRTIQSGYSLTLDSVGELCRTSGSSIRYKDLDRHLTKADVEKLYDLPVWRAKFKKGYLAEDDPKNGMYMPMFVAEEVAEILPEATDINADGTVENWDARIMIPAMFQMIKDLKDEIKDLKSELEVLKNGKIHGV